MIREISALETFPVRHPVLRAGKPVESCRFEGDDLPTTMHFGYYERGQLLGVASLFAVDNPEFEYPAQLQLRGMAVMPDQQKKGIGDELLRHAEQFAHDKHYKLIWFNAREIAVGFYQKLGYDVWGGPFDIPGIGIHFMMFKKLR